MSLSDFAAPPRHSSLDEPGLVATLLHWLTRADAGADASAPNVDERREIYATREKGYLHDIGI
ncbi:hypothetical protein QKW60_01925 [Defluviimonas aestuarii]|uniref:hypothetical protein n=1 Tax=Albidovulum aestuarii TaxID=1130726 RepID=UPI00249BA51F|nr:hypothetical protein [Defluviimonas aestuarii]MDI3335150.1 hypothetical protein [Defluviimonas aestuarii]